MRDHDADQDTQILALFDRHGTLTLWGIAAMLHHSKNRRATRQELAATQQALNRLVARGLLVTVGPPRRRTFRVAPGLAGEYSAVGITSAASDMHRH
jgi:hypothetical protein